MALKKETAAKIAALLKIKPEDFQAALEATEEKDITVPDINAFTPDELKTLKDNEYKRGKEVGVEMSVKDAREKHGLEGKTIEELLTAHGTKVLEQAKIEPDKKVQELQQKLDVAQNTVTQLQTDLQNSKSALVQRDVDTQISKVLPENTIISGEKLVALAKADGFAFELKDGKLVAKKGDALELDHLGNTKDVKTVLSEYATANKLIKEAKGAGGGRGGSGSGKSTVFASLSELKKSFVEQGKSLMGEEFNAAFEKARTDNPDFVME